MKRYLSAASAAALALSLVAGVPAPAVAQDVSQLRDALSTDLVEIGIDPAVVDGLSDEQVAEIYTLVNSGMANDATLRLQIEEIIAGG